MCCKDLFDVSPILRRRFKLYRLLFQCADGRGHLVLGSLLALVYTAVFSTQMYRSLYVHIERLPFLHLKIFEFSLKLRKLRTQTLNATIISMISKLSYENNDAHWSIKQFSLFRCHDLVGPLYSNTTRWAPPVLFWTYSSLNCASLNENDRKIDGEIPCRRDGIVFVAD